MTSLDSSGFQLIDVAKSYRVDRIVHPAVRELSIEFAMGGRYGVIGESGSGKSTVARMLAALEKPSSGSILYDGKDLVRWMADRASRLEFRRRVQLISQDTSSSFDPRRTLRDSLTVPVRKLRGLKAKGAVERVEAVLHRLALDPDLVDRYPHEVSGGQRQRFAIARALVVEPRTLICDEVVSALDVSVQGAVLNMLREYCETAGTGLIFVSHGLPATAFISKEIVVMYRGEVVDRGTSDAVIRRPQHEYTRHLITGYSPADVSGGAA